MRGFSRVVLAGNLTKDPDLRNTTTGRSVCAFSIAVNRSYRDTNGGQKEEVSFIDCSAWARTGEMIAQYAKKGDPILVSGRLNQRFWEDKTGAKRSTTEVVVDDFVFLGGKRDGGSGDYFDSSAKPAEPAAPNSAPAAKAAAGDIPDDIPEEVGLEEIPF